MATLVTVAEVEVPGRNLDAEIGPFTLPAPPAGCVGTFLGFGVPAGTSASSTL